MILFLLAASALLAYGLVYVRFTIKKGGIAAALVVLMLVLVDMGLLALVLYYRTHT